MLWARAPITKGRVSCSFFSREHAGLSMGAGTSRDRLKHAVVKLVEEDVPDAGENPEANDFWDCLWKISSSPEEVFEFIRPDDVRRLKEQKKQNLKILFTQAVAQICQVVETPSPIYFDQALNCVRVLTRLLPFLLEKSDDPFVHALCWVRLPPPQEQGSDSKEAVVYDPLAVLLLHAAMHLLFLPQFTIDIPAHELLRATAGQDAAEDDDDDDEEGEASLIWSSGVGVEEDFGHTTAYDRNRLEVLRLLLTCLCDPLYHKADGPEARGGSFPSRWLAVATSAGCPHASSLFHSLLNTVIGFDPVGWGLPIGSIWTGSVSQRYLDVALQVLLVLLDYGQPANDDESAAIPPPQEEANAAHGGDRGSGGEAATAAATEEGPDGAPSSGSGSTGSSSNYYRQLLSSIRKPEDLTFIYEGMVRLLSSVHMAQSTYIPGAMLQIQFHQELLVLLWKLLEETPAFMPHILKHHDITQLVVPICYLIFDARRDPSKVGLVHICTFILLKLSGERNFGVALNKPFDQKLPIDLPLFTGNHCDLLVIVLHKIIVQGGDKLSALYHCFLTIICNVSPYCKALSLVASVKLLNLFELFTSPRFLYAAESNHMYVSLLLEIMNNMVQYQYDGNPHLVYSIVRRKDAFYKLANLTLPLAIKAAKESSHPRSGSSASDSSTSAAAKRSDSTDSSSGTPPTEAPTQVINTQAQQTQLPEGGGGGEGRGATHTRLSGGGGGASSTTVSKGTGSSEEVKQQQQDLAPPSTPSSSSGPGMSSRFLPTEEWLQTVKSELPITTMMRLLQYLVPQLEEMCRQGVERGQGVDEKTILAFLKSTTLVGLLPVPHAIVIRKYQANRFTSLWFTAYLWGVIFLRNQQLPLFDGAAIRLFTVTVASN